MSDTDFETLPLALTSTGEDVVHLLTLDDGSSVVWLKSASSVAEEIENIANSGFDYIKGDFHLADQVFMAARDEAGSPTHVFEMNKSYRMIIAARRIDNAISISPLLEKALMLLETRFRFAPTIADSLSDGSHRVGNAVVYIKDGLRHRDGKPAEITTPKNANFLTRGIAMVFGGKPSQQVWYQNGVLHRDDGPAVETDHGYEAWHIQGLLHRTDGPALTDDGNQFWFKQGLKHREDGPAEIHKNGREVWFHEGKTHRGDDLPAINGYYGVGISTPEFLTPPVTSYKAQFWFKDGAIHRENAPAVIDPDHFEAWMQDGKLHRTDGPAISLSNGDYGWYKNGVPHREDGPAIKEGSQTRWMVDGKLHRIGEVAHEGAGVSAWYENGVLHRTDGPAYITDKKSAWYFEGQLHREDGPAVEYKNGTRIWYKHGVPFRENGPARTEPDGGEAWFKDGYIHRDGHPAVISPNYEKWYQRGLLHRADGPAVKHSDGGEEWWEDGKRHRLDGPAITRPDGFEEHYLYGRKVKEDADSTDFLSKILHPQS